MQAFTFQPPLFWPFLLADLFIGVGLIGGALLRYLICGQFTQSSRGTLAFGIPLAASDSILLLYTYWEKVTITGSNDTLYLFLPLLISIAVAGSWLLYCKISKSRKSSIA